MIFTKFVGGVSEYFTDLSFVLKIFWVYFTSRLTLYNLPLAAYQAHFGEATQFSAQNTFLLW